jgi:hypothetical protein
MSDLNPETFDLDAWIEGADRTVRSATVYQKAGLIGDLDLLATQIETAEAEEAIDGPGMGGGSGKLRAKYAKLAAEFKASALVIRMKALTVDEKKAIEEEHKEDTGAHILAASMVEPRVTAAQIRKLEKAIGNAQMALIIQAYNRACDDVPAVSADFLPKSSGRDASEG